MSHTSVAENGMSFSQYKDKSFGYDVQQSGGQVPVFQWNQTAGDGKKETNPSKFCNYQATIYTTSF